MCLLTAILAPAAPSFWITGCCTSTKFGKVFDWWQQAGSTFNKDVGRGFNSLVMLGAWILWKERNDIVFNGVSPRLDRALLLAQDEADHWMLAGAKGLRGLVAAASRGG